MKTGVLFIHGFTGGTYEVQPFITYVKEQTDWKVEVPTLPGHGVTLDLGKISAEAWMMEAELALRRLKKRVDRVLVVGFSMGGLIAMYLSRRYPTDRLILLSPATKYISPRMLLADARHVLTESITRNYAPNTFYHLYDYKFKNTPFRSTLEFLRVVKMVKPYYSQIITPVCIVQGGRDAIVPSFAAEYLYEKVGSPRKKLIKSAMGMHHICYSDDCNDWFIEALAFMQADNIITN